MTVRPDPPSNESAGEPASEAPAQAESSSEATEAEESQGAAQETEPTEAEPSEPAASEAASGDAGEPGESTEPAPEPDEPAPEGAADDTAAEPAPGDSGEASPASEEQPAEEGEPDRDPNRATPEEVSAGVADPEDAAPHDEGGRPGADENPHQPSSEDAAANEVPGLLGEETAVPADDDFRRDVEARVGRIETPASILDGLDEEWRGSRDEADATRTEADGGMSALLDSWNDPAIDEARRRVGLPVGETKEHGEASNAVRDPIRGAREQLNTAVGERERLIEEGARNLRLAEATQPSPDRALTRERIIELTAGEIRDVDAKAANAIRNDPRWAPLTAEAPNPEPPPDPTTARLTATGAALDLGANTVGQRKAAEFGSKALNLGKYGGMALGVPGAIAAAAADVENGETRAQAAASNFGGLAAGAVVGASIGGLAGGLGAVPGAAIGAVAGGVYSIVASGMIDSVFEEGLDEPYDAVRMFANGWSDLADAGQAAGNDIATVGGWAANGVNRAWNAVF